MHRDLTDEDSAHEIWLEYCLNSYNGYVSLLSESAYLGLLIRIGN